MRTDEVRSLAHLALSLTDFTLTRTLELVRVIDGLVTPDGSRHQSMADPHNPDFDPQGWPEPTEESLDSPATEALLARRRRVPRARSCGPTTEWILHS